MPGTSSPAGSREALLVVDVPAEKLEEGVDKLDAGLRLVVTASAMRGGYYSYKSRFIRHLPIHEIALVDGPEKKRQDRLVRLVDRMLALNKNLAAAKAPHDQTVLEGQIEATERQIDMLVYELYGLTDKEMEIVEHATSAQTDSEEHDVAGDNTEDDNET